MLGGKRIDRVNELIRQEVGELLKREVDFEQGTLVTVKRVDVSPDLEHAKVWISVLPVERTDAVMELLKERIGELQRLLNRKLAMGPVPKLRFLIDESEGQASRIEELLDSLDGTR